MPELVFKRNVPKAEMPTVIIQKKPYPTDKDGICLSPSEIDLPKFHLDPNDDPDYNNHHLYYYARMYETQGCLCAENLQKFIGCGVLFHVLRNLQSNQILMSSMQHKILHDRYSPPERPTVEQAMDIVIKAYEEGGFLRLGTANRFKEKKLNKRIMECIKNEFNDHRRVI
ncbi:MAG: hypothetical protein PWQ10_563 [Patescibacteria group bacterium]|nr:hypothetical protein [Patescibacteria group bacterium]